MTTRRLHFETFEPRKLLAADMMIPGDANHDGGFDSSDLITVFQTGEYEDDIEDNSVWEEGDWNGDGDFNSSDLVVALTVIIATPSDEMLTVGDVTLLVPDSTFTS